MALYTGKGDLAAENLARFTRKNHATGRDGFYKT